MTDSKTLYLEIAPLIESTPEPVNKQRLKDYMGRIEEISERIKETAPNHYEAKSSWDALIFCIGQIAHWSSQPLLTDPKAPEPDKSAMHLVFRGQSNKDWHLEASIWRGKDVGYWDRYHGAFCLMLKHAYEKCIAFPLQAWIFQAAAQHFRIPTELLDWSTDPAIAIWFAARPELPVPGQMARIFCMPTHNITRAFDKPGQRGIVLLPPPFVENLYVQRGLFTRVPEGKNEDLRQRCLFELTFPQDPSYEVIRENEPLLVEKSVPWIDNLKSWADNCATKGRTFDGDIPAKLAALDAELDELGKPDFLDSKNADSLAEVWRDRTLEMVRRLAHFESDSHEIVQDALFDNIVCDNTRLMAAMARYFKDRAEKGQDEHKTGYQQYADRIQGSLDRCSNKLN